MELHHFSITIHLLWALQLYCNMHINSLLIHLLDKEHTSKVEIMVGGLAHQMLTMIDQVQTMQGL